MICNLTRQTLIASTPKVADTLLWQTRGMIARQFDPFDALIFHKCRSIHTWFMQMPIDVLFLDRDSRVAALRHTLRPWRMAGAWRGRTVVELPAGTLARLQTAVGDQIDLAATAAPPPAA